MDICFSTGKSFSEALILESVNPQYNERLLIEFPEKYKRASEKDLPVRHSTADKNKTKF